MVKNCLKMVNKRLARNIIIIFNKNFHFLKLFHVWYTIHIGLLIDKNLDPANFYKAIFISLMSLMKQAADLFWWFNLSSSRLYTFNSFLYEIYSQRLLSTRHFHFHAHKSICFRDSQPNLLIFIYLLFTYP